MKRIGYARCAVCDQLCAGYAPRAYKAGDALHVWSHLHAGGQTGWGRQAKCPGSYKAGIDSRTDAELQASEVQE